MVVFVPRFTKKPFSGFGGGAVTMGVPARGKTPVPSRKVSSSNTASAKSAGQVGRSGASPLSASNASSDVFQFSRAYTTTATSVTDSVPLTADGDYVGMIVKLTVTPTGNTGTVDILNAIEDFSILAPDGVIMNMSPANDFYKISQRFNPLHLRPATVNTNGATSVTGTYFIYGISLPVNRGSYSVMYTIPAPTNFGTSTTSLGVTIEIDMVLGSAPNRSRFVFSNFPVTPTANGVVDISPLAPIQDVALTELFIGGLNSNIADITYLQILSQGNTVGTRVTASDLVARDNAVMVNPLRSTEIYPLLALQSNLTLGRNSHVYTTFGASPSASIMLGYYWLD